MRYLLALVPLIATPAVADSVLAARTLRAQTVLTAQDVVLKDIDVIGAAERIEDVIGQETRVAVYAGRPVRLGDLSPPAVIERNQIVPLIFHRGGLNITSEGRAMMRAAPGDYARVMNLSSRITVTGRVTQDGRVIVSD